MHSHERFLVCIRFSCFGVFSHLVILVSFNFWCKFLWILLLLVCCLLWINVFNNARSEWCKKSRLCSCLILLLILFTAASINTSTCSDFSCTDWWCAFVKNMKHQKCRREQFSQSVTVSSSLPPSALSGSCKSSLIMYHLLSHWKNVRVFYWALGFLGLNLGL